MSSIRGSNNSYVKKGIAWAVLGVVGIALLAGAHPIASHFNIPSTDVLVGGIAVTAIGVLGTLYYVNKKRQEVKRKRAMDRFLRADGRPEVFTIVK